WLELARLQARGSLLGFVPGDHASTGRQGFRTAIVVTEVVGMFPNVVAKNRKQALGNGVVLVGGAENLHFATLLARQPCPAAAELLDTGIVELGLKILEAAKRLLDGLRNRAAGIAAAFGLH